MANWDNITSRGSIEDRRGAGPTAVGGGLSVLGLIILVAINFLGGGSATDVIPQIINSQVQTQDYSANSSEYDGQDSYETFASTVLGSNNEYWTKALRANGIAYSEPKLVLFRGSTNSSCGGATAQDGPHYCPLDKTIYLDETFFDELQNQFDAGIGDVAQAYVISHEVGHHVQNLLGTIGSERTNSDSIKTELQADCYAGLWAGSIKDQNVFEPGEIKEALDAASAVGDDRIQSATTGRVNPETWTHGSSVQRVSWFTTGYNAPSFDSCNTFK
jgi:uncharacterized protein